MQQFEQNNQNSGYKFERNGTKKPRRWIGKTIAIIFILIVGATGLLMVKAYTLTGKIFGSNGSFLSTVRQLFDKNSGNLQGQLSDGTGTVNILLLGYGGPGHDGPYLTDSMILASIDFSKKQVLLTSIPRDLKWTNPSGNPAKINEAFSDGYLANNNFDQGGQAAEQAVSQLSGLTIPYYASMDFQGFVDAINQVGGIDINVPNSFTDSQFPSDQNDPGSTGYMAPQTFVAGQQHMDGERALIYARSRHGTNGEDSDFARSKRQELVLQAFKAKIAGLNLITNSGTFDQLVNTLANHFHTNISPAQLYNLISTLRSSQFQIQSRSLDESNGLICQTDSGVFYLIPCNGVSPQQIQAYFQQGFDQASATSQIGNEHGSIIIENAGNNDLYFQIGTQLKAAGVNVYEVAYKGIPLDRSQLYEIDSAAPQLQKFLENKLGVTAKPKPASMVAKSDLVLFVGGSPSSNSNQ